MRLCFHAFSYLCGKKDYNVPHNHETLKKPLAIMKFVIQSTELYARLQVLGRVIVSKNNLPILDCVLFETHGGSLTLTASDNETTVMSTAPLVECEADFRFAVKARTMLDAMKELPEQPLTFFVNSDTFEITIEYLNGCYRLIGQAADDYPAAPAVDGEHAAIRLDAARLLTAINHTAFAADADDLRPVMSGIYFDVEGMQVNLVATDRHKLVCDHTPLAAEAAKGAFILPRKPAALLKNILPKAEGEVCIEWNSRHAVVAAGDTRVICRLIEGRYPNYQAVIPQDNGNVATINRAALLAALRRVLVFSNATSALVKLSFSGSKLTLSSQDIDFSMSAEEALLCDYQGAPINIGFKGTFLIDLLNNLESEEVTISLADPSRPGVIVPTPQEEGESVLMLLMPLMLND